MMCHILLRAEINDLMLTAFAGKQPVNNLMEQSTKCYGKTCFNSAWMNHEGFVREGVLEQGLGGWL